MVLRSFWLSHSAKSSITGAQRPATKSNQAFLSALKTRTQEHHSVWRCESRTGIAMKLQAGGTSQIDLQGSDKDGPSLTDEHKNWGAVKSKMFCWSMLIRGSIKSSKIQKYLHRRCSWKIFIPSSTIEQSKMTHGFSVVYNAENLNPADQATFPVSAST